MSEKNIELGIMVLTAGYWPLQSTTKMNLPAEMLTLFDDFSKSYRTTHTGRRLDLLQAQSRGELVCTAFPDHKYTFIVSSLRLGMMGSS